MSEVASNPQLLAAPGEVDERSRRRVVMALVTLAMFLDAVFFALIAPLLPEISDRLALSRFEVGLLFATHPAGTFLAAPPAAVLVRRIGSRTTVTLGLIALAVGTIVLGFASGLILLMVSRFLQGASASLVWCGGLARLQAISPPERRGAALGLAGSAAAAGALFGPALAALSVVVGTEVLLSGLGLIALVVCLVLHLAGELRGETSGDNVDDLSPFAVGNEGGTGYGTVRPVTVIVCCGIVFGAVATLAPLRLDELGAGVVAIAAIFSLSAICEMFASPFAGHYSDRVGRIAPIRICLLVAMPLMIVLALADSAWIMALAVPVAGAAITALWPLGAALLSDEAGANNRPPAAAFAASVVGWSGGLMLGSLLVGALATVLGEGVAFAVLVLPCLFAFAVIRAPRGLSPSLAR